MSSIPLFPTQASTIAPAVDSLFAFLMVIAVFFSTLIGGLILFFAFKYHHSTNADRTGADKEHLALEIAWTVIPLGITMVIFFWGAHVFYRLKAIPNNAMEIFVVGKQWMWKIQHPEGPREINALHVPLGQPVQLTMISEDVIHDFSIPDFRVKNDVIPGRYTTEWFEATKTGHFHLYCSQYCGTLHSGMVGEVVVMEPKEYERWLGGGGSSGSMSNSGAELFTRMACASCHLPNGQGRGPSLVGLYGKKVALKGDQTIVADDAYIRESILKPEAKVVKGYQVIMPSFQNTLSEENILALIAYIKSLNGANNTAASQ
jgi:cytochrome c oxidase subunit II